ncbi:transposase [Streptomyces sp. NBC_01718]
MRPRSQPPSSEESVERLIAAGQWQAGNPDIVIVSDAGYDVTRLAWVLRDLPVELVGRVRSDRVMRLPKPPRMHGVNGRPPKHGPEFRFTKPETWPEPVITTVTDTTNYGKAETQVHPRLTHRSSWLDHDGELLLVEGTLMRLKVEYLSKERDAPPVWLWSSKTGATPDDVDRFWQAFLRRFDLEHTFCFAKQTLGWITPKLRTLEAADRWTWILIVAHTQLQLARPLAADLRRPWEKPTTSCSRPPGSLQVLWALGTPPVRRLIEVLQTRVTGEVLATAETEHLWVRVGGDSTVQRARAGVIAARFRHYENCDGQPLLHDHAGCQSSPASG